MFSYFALGNYVFQQIKTQKVQFLRGSDRVRKKCLTLPSHFKLV